MHASDTISRTTVKGYEGASIGINVAGSHPLDETIDHLFRSPKPIELPGGLFRMIRRKDHRVYPDLAVEGAHCRAAEVSRRLPAASQLNYVAWNRENKKRDKNLANSQQTPGRIARRRSAVFDTGRR
jgi:hypothetical protein